MTSGVRLRETRVAIRSPGFRPSGESGPTSSTTPTSMPPEPVTGFCILPRRAMISSDRGPHGRAVAPVRASVSWRNDAASRFSRSTRDPDLVRREGRAGVQPPGRLGQHSGRFSDPVQSQR